MSDILKYPSWQAPLQDLILEFDGENFKQRAVVVELLIFARLQELQELRELQRPTDGYAELDALNDALRVLHKIRDDRLGNAEQQTRAGEPRNPTSLPGGRGTFNP
jgi:hypothetical protein